MNFVITSKYVVNIIFKEENALHVVCVTVCHPIADSVFSYNNFGVIVSVLNKLQCVLDAKRSDSKPRRWSSINCVKS